MVQSHKKGLVTLDDRFEFDEDSFPVGAERWPSHLRAATGRTDRERYLLRLFRKSGTSLDADLKRFIGRGIRRIRRVLSSRRARDILVEVVDVVEDDNEIAIVMLDPGSPISGASKRSRTR